MNVKRLIEDLLKSSMVSDLMIANPVFMKEYKFIRKIKIYNDTLNSSLYRNIKSNELAYVIKQQFVTRNKQDLENVCNYIQMSSCVNQCESLNKMFGFTYQIDQVESKLTIILIYEYGETSIIQEIDRRSQIPKNQAQIEELLWEFLDKSTLALSYIESLSKCHGFITRDAFFCFNMREPPQTGNKVPEIQTLYFPMLLQKDSYFEIVNNRLQYHQAYLSPEELVKLASGIKSPMLDQIKCDVFSLGMVIIDLFCYSDYHRKKLCYEKQQPQINKLAFQQKILFFQQNFSGPLCYLLENMLKFNPMQRPSFCELQITIKKYLRENVQQFFLPPKSAVPQKRYMRVDISREESSIYSYQDKPAKHDQNSSIDSSENNFPIQILNHLEDQTNNLGEPVVKQDNLNQLRESFATTALKPFNRFSVINQVENQYNPSQVSQGVSNRTTINNLDRQSNPQFQDNNDYMHDNQEFGGAKDPLGRESYQLTNPYSASTVQSPEPRNRIPSFSQNQHPDVQYDNLTRQQLLVDQLNSLFAPQLNEQVENDASFVQKHLPNNHESQSNNNSYDPVLNDEPPYYFNSRRINQGNRQEEAQTPTEYNYQQKFEFNIEQPQPHPYQPNQAKLNKYPWPEISGINENSGDLEPLVHPETARHQQIFKHSEGITPPLMHKTQNDDIVPPTTDYSATPNNFVYHHSKTNGVPYQLEFPSTENQRGRQHTQSKFQTLQSSDKHMQISAPQRTRSSSPLNAVRPYRRFDSLIKTLQQKYNIMQFMQNHDIEEIVNILETQIVYSQEEQGVPSSKKKTYQKDIQIIEFPDGSRYTGFMQMDMRNGRGIFYYINGEIYAGNWLNDKFSGQGVYLFENKDIYIGELSFGMKHGYGKYFYIDGNFYDGEWRGNAQDGFGKMKYSNGDIFEGNWKDNQKCGEGAYFFKDGDQFLGHWIQGQKFGRGVVFFSDGGIFEGHWTQDQPNGQGRLCFQNGDVFEGNYVQGQRQGYGIYVHADDGGKYEGGWNQGQRTGEGLYYYSNGDQYKGMFTNGQRNGKGTYYYNDDKSKFIGTWKNNLKDGHGIIEFGDGAIYEGSFEKGSKNGQGIMVFANREVYRGFWRNDVREGTGRYEWNDKSYYVGDWKNDQMNGKGIFTDEYGAVIQGVWENDKIIMQLQAPSIEDYSEQKILRNNISNRISKSPNSISDENQNLSQFPFKNKNFYS